VQGDKDWKVYLLLPFGKGDRALRKRILEIDDARKKIETWRRDYNEFRPHSALDNMTPEEYVKQHIKKPEISNYHGTAFG